MTNLTLWRTVFLSISKTMLPMAFPKEESPSKFVDSMDNLRDSISHRSLVGVIVNGGLTRDATLELDQVCFFSPMQL